MTADSPTPGTDDFRPVLGEPETPAYPYPTPGTETCQCPADDTGSAIEYETCEACFLPYAAPSPVDTTEPPAETHDPDTQPWQRNLLAHHAQPPAETQQDDEREHRVNECDCGHLARNHELTRYGGCRLCSCTSLRQAGNEPAAEALDARAALAARPSADTETLRDVLLKHHPIAHSETGPLKGCRCGQVKLGQDVIAHVTAQLVAALDAR